MFWNVSRYKNMLWKIEGFILKIEGNPYWITTSIQANVFIQICPFTTSSKQTFNILYTFQKIYGTFGMRYYVFAYIYNQTLYVISDFFKFTFRYFTDHFIGYKTCKDKAGVVHKVWLLIEALMSKMCLINKGPFVLFISSIWKNLHYSLDSFKK